MKDFIKKIKLNYIKRQKPVFIFHGNTDDIFENENENNDFRFSEYLKNYIFKSRDHILEFNIGTGLTFHNENTMKTFFEFMKNQKILHGNSHSNSDSKSPSDILNFVDKFLKFQSKKEKENSISLIISDCDLILPNDEISNLNLDEKKLLVLIKSWATSEFLKKKDITISLICQNLFDLNQKLVNSSDISKITVSFPDEFSRKKSVKKYANSMNVNLKNITQKSLAKITNGLNTKQIKELFLTFKDEKLELSELNKIKKELIENHSKNLIEFVQTEKNLNFIAGHEKAKTRLKQDSKLLKKHPKIMPMGYLICGPVGTGKSYIAECFAGECDVPVVKIKNFRDKWVGSTESNFELILNTLKNLSPVIVIIDEADAQLGNRESDDSSGTNKRVFGKLAEIMGDTKNRGKIIWMLLTSRPELLPVDLKRQGRAEVHIPLFYPKDFSEKKTFIKIIAKKLDFPDQEISFLEKNLKSEDLKHVRSGADIESVLISLKREKIISKFSSKKRDLKSLFFVFRNFRSSLSDPEIQNQIENAKKEITDMNLI